MTLLGVIVLACWSCTGGEGSVWGALRARSASSGVCRLDARRAVYLVKVGKLVYVVGASEGLT